MQHFPVVCSTLSATHLGKFLQQQYHLSAGTTCRLLRAAINHAYLVTDGRHKYVFRVYSLNWRSGIEIAEEIRLLQLLKDNGIPVSYAIPDPQGNYIHQIPAPEGVRLGVLFSFAKGEKQLNIPEALHFKIGEIMARMHQVTHNMSLQRVQYNPEVLLEDSFELLKQYISVDTEEMRFMQHAQQYLLQQYHNVQDYPFRNGIIHLDIWFDNLNIHNNDEVTLFDFDFCGNGWLLHDIAYYMLQVYNTEREEDQYRLKLDSFIKGYESVTLIPEAEKQLIPTASISIYFFYLGVQCLRFENWTNTFLNETYLKRYINVVIKKLYNHYQLPSFES
ncbi:aminoglycoside phosphotransferase [Niastella caeni]|uniref:Aminoglycoside phosphotransferase n=1 Tax=Niastella caeni TaxID=2569763 RepID=A0A4S8HEV8_9BACT|nr:phosphotransferase [Niastella caeni]THU32004.1 aminoglycoside phosphotransferase [Niastella caeni]